VDKLKGEQAAPVEGGGSGRFQRDAADRAEKTPGGAS
jgi:hypothetical protein